MLNEERKTEVLSRSEADTEIKVDSFMITGLSDPLDPYAFVIVKHKLNEEVFTGKDRPDTVWSDPGVYNITLL